MQFFLADTIIMGTGRTWQHYLQFLSQLGVTHLPTVCLPKPSVSTGLSERQTSSSSAAQSKSRIAQGSRVHLKSPDELQPDSVRIPDVLSETSEIFDAPLSTIKDKSEALCQLANVVAECRRCSALAETRTQTVFGVGRADARIMFVGEAPGADEDQQGEPFVGRAGKLLNRIIEACQLKREDLYICNILRCRPPGNRNPRPQEAANCREFLDAQLRVVDPEYIVCWGTVAAQNLLNEKRTIGKLRGVFHRHNQAKVLCTYHPSYLLRNPSARKDVWNDMQILMRDLGIKLN
ncbi:MAG: uracil-DNA glycosylase [Fuerstiella sp.]|nr:uracil-DNA glycosylase [Fuerstiella sp.]